MGPNSLSRCTLKIHLDVDLRCGSGSFLSLLCSVNANVGRCSKAPLTDFVLTLETEGVRLVPSQAGFPFLDPH